VGIDDGCPLDVGELEGTLLKVGELEGRKLGDNVLLVEGLERVGALLLMSLGEVVTFVDKGRSFLVIGVFSRRESMRASTMETVIATMTKPNAKTARRLIVCCFDISFPKVCL
jgi:hypothetical protein